MHTLITHCRICKNTNLESIVELGEQCLTGVFPATKEEHIPKGPLSLVKCIGDDKSCGLVQLQHSYDSSEMYGDNYGYRSGLNVSMVDHLHGIVKKAQEFVTLKPGDLIIDIGSNDATLLNSYPDNGYDRVGIDPTAEKFREFYKKDINVIPDFFSSANIKKYHPTKKASIITSIAMFYDLEDPIQFAKEITDVLADDGIWVFEQSYILLMLQTHAYDTICHEHIEYYSLKQIKWILDAVGLKIIDIETNDTNGGSFRVTAAKQSHPHQEAEKAISDYLENEKKAKLDTMDGYQEFKDAIFKHREELTALVKRLCAEGKKIFAYGASTKGNVILQYCGFTPAEIPYVAEVNEYKFGRFTPGTHLPIISEKEAKALKPDYLLVLPWHFKKNILKRETDYINSGGHLIFPLPQIEII
ncbi:MAG: class I SAM-dependent methyltransferase [Weeksellaceae bacterium]